MIKYLGLKIGDTLRVEQKMDTYKNRVVSGGHISLQSHRTIAFSHKRGTVPPQCNVFEYGNNIYL